eukprot:scaffold129384_cov30-Tisochrysis_lutea.AAC.1
MNVGPPGEVHCVIKKRYLCYPTVNIRKTCGPFRTYVGARVNSSLETARDGPPAAPGAHGSSGKTGTGSSGLRISRRKSGREGERYKDEEVANESRLNRQLAPRD